MRSGDHIGTIPLKPLTPKPLESFPHLTTLSGPIIPPRGWGPPPPPPLHLPEWGVMVAEGGVMVAVVALRVRGAI